MRTLRQLQQGVDLDPLELRHLFGGATKIPPDTEQLPAHTCLSFWLFALLKRLRFLTLDQQRLLYSEIVPSLSAWMPAVTAGTSVLLLIADSRYATWYERVGWLNLHTGLTDLEQHRFLEIVSYDLTTLFQRNSTSCQVTYANDAQ